MIEQFNNPLLFEAHLFIHIIIFIILLLTITFLSLRYWKRKTINNLILIFIFFFGFISTIANFIINISNDIDLVRPFIGLLSIFGTIIILIILNKRLEKKVEEKTLELEKSNQIIKEQIEKLKEIDQIRSDILRRTSHELKTPLISIFSSTQHLLNEYKDEMSKDVIKFVKVINRGGKRLKLLTNNLVDAYKIESNGFKLKKSKIDLIKTLKNCANDMVFSLKERDLYLKVELTGEFYIEVDEIRIEQVILNIISNAIKNTPSKGIIFITLKNSENYADVIIRDTGVGFTEAEKNEIFKKFGKIERRGIEKDLDTEGSGLGLFISKEIIERHGGTIILESEGRNQGSSFIIRIPMDSVSI